MKFLLVFAVVFIAIYLWRRNRRDEIRSRPPPPTQKPAVGAPKDMVRCAHCGLHLPKTDAIEGPDGIYCSPAHRKAAGH